MHLIAYLLAFGTDTPIPTREIDIPEHEIDEEPSIDSLLELAFKFSQNDFQPRPIRSVSVGDVIKLGDGSLHRVLGCGWEPLPAGTDITTLERGASASFR